MEQEHVDRAVPDAMIRSSNQRPMCKILYGAGAPVAELVDALDSKSSSRKGVGVRFSPGAPLLHGLN